MKQGHFEYICYDDIPVSSIIHHGHIYDNRSHIMHFYVIRRNGKKMFIFGSTEKWHKGSIAFTIRDMLFDSSYSEVANIVYNMLIQKTRSYQQIADFLNTYTPLPYGLYL